MQIVDEFIVTLGLDPSAYKKQKADFLDDLRRTKDETRRSTREMESDTRRAAEGFSRLKNEIVGLFLVVAGGRSIGALVQDMIHGAAETGRFGQAIGVATERVSVWEMAVQSMGGTAEDARASLAALNNEYTSYMLTGRAVHDADLAAMGIGARDLQSPEQLALSLAERRSHMTQREFTARLQRLGLPDSFIRTLAQGRHGVQDLLTQMERIGPITDRDARAAQNMEREWANLTNRLRNELRPALTWLVEEGLPWIIEHGPTVARVMGIGIGGATALMTVQFIRAAGPLGVLIAGLTTLIGLWSQMSGSDVLSGLTYLYRGIHVAALRRDLEAFDQANHLQLNPINGQPLQTPENRRIMQERLHILQMISEAEDSRYGALEGSGYSQNRATGGFYGPADGPGAAGGGGGGHAGPAGDLARVRQTESGGNYNRVVYDIMSPPRPLTGMTMGQVFDWQRGPLRARTRGRRGPHDIGSTGAGAYQFESLTLAENARLEFGAGWRDVPFSAPNQDRVAERLRSRRGLTPWAIGQRGGAQTAVRARGGAGGTHVSVGSIVVYTPHGTPRAQAEAVAREIPRAVQRKGVVTQANSGLN